MELVRLGRRGQITISKMLREQLGVDVNVTLLAYVQDGRLVLEPLPKPRRDLQSLIGLLPAKEPGRLNVQQVRNEVRRYRANERVRRLSGRPKDRGRFERGLVGQLIVAPNEHFVECKRCAQLAYP